MIYIETATRAELECAVLENDEILNAIDEEKFYSGGITDQELRDVLAFWVESKPDFTC